MPDRVLFVHAHPDDESIVTGGALATLVERGVPVTVLTCTRGEKGEVIPADIAHLEGDDEGLAALRELEIAAAMAVLGVNDHRFLGASDARRVDSPPRRYRDSGMRWGDDGPEPLETMASDALCAADPAEVAADIATVIATTDARVVVSYDSDGGYGHPDHVAVHIAARAAADAMEVPFFAITGSAPGPGTLSHARASRRHPPATGGRIDREGTVPERISIDVGPVLEKKLAALRAYRSQLTVDGRVLRMPGGQIEPILLIEEFELIPPSSESDEAPGRETAPRSRAASGRNAGSGLQAVSVSDAPREAEEWAQLGRAARVVASVGALVLGVAAAGVGTVMHQVRPDVLGVPVPIGLVLSLVVVAALLAGLRLAFDSRVLATIAAASFLVVVNILSKQSAGGSVLIQATPLGYWWVYAPVVITFLVLAWPKLPARPRDRIESEFESKGTPAP